MPKNGLGICNPEQVVYMFACPSHPSVRLMLLFPLSLARRKLKQKDEHERDQVNFPLFHYPISIGYYFYADISISFRMQ